MSAHLTRAIMDIAQASSRSKMPQAYYVPLYEWLIIRQELMQMTRTLPRVDRVFGYPFFQVLTVPVVPFSALEPLHADAKQE